MQGGLSTMKLMKKLLVLALAMILAGIIIFTL